MEGGAARTLWASAGGGMLDEFNATSRAMLDLFGLQAYTITRQDTVQFVKHPPRDSEPEKLLLGSKDILCVQGALGR